MGLCLGVIDERGNFGEKAFASERDIALDFASTAKAVVACHEFTDALFKKGCLHVSDYVKPVFQLSGAQPFVPILNENISELIPLVNGAGLDPRVRDTLVEFLKCCERSGLDVTFC